MHPATPTAEASPIADTSPIADPSPTAETIPAVGLPLPATTPFAHHSEAELARILDFYEVRWEYEPHVYPILWSLDGAVQESFAPDFYLPDLDLYVELTTLRQRLVRKKNRKMRRLRELYPDIRIKLFYERDFRALMLKYGKLAIADEMTGTVGQVGSVPLSIGDPSVLAPGARPSVETARGVSADGPPVAHVAGAAGAPVDTRPAARRPRRIHEATTR
jgi:hypothetical protein